MGARQGEAIYAASCPTTTPIAPIGKFGSFLLARTFECKPRMRPRINLSCRVHDTADSEQMGSTAPVREPIDKLMSGLFEPEHRTPIEHVDRVIVTLCGNQTAKADDASLRNRQTVHNRNPTTQRSTLENRGEVVTRPPSEHRYDARQGATHRGLSQADRVAAINETATTEPEARVPVCGSEVLGKTNHLKRVAHRVGQLLVQDEAGLGQCGSRKRS